MLLLAIGVADAQDICPSPPSCAVTPAETRIRAWVSKQGRWQKTCDIDDKWSSGCVFECYGYTSERMYNCVSFGSDDVGWMAGPMGLLVKTSNRGRSWDSQTTRTVEDYFGMYFLSASEGWLVGSNSHVGHTTNGGSTWVWRTDLIDTRDTNIFYAVHFHNKTTGWIVGTAGRIYRTFNGGADWQIRTYEVGMSYFDVHFADENTGIVVGMNGRLLWTNNAGTSWISQRSGTTADLRGAHCLNGTHGFVVGYAGALLQTTDAGSTWAVHEIATPAMYLLGVRFGSNTDGWAVGQEGDPSETTGAGVLLATTDGGLTWSRDRRTSLMNQRLTAVATLELAPPPCPTTTTLEPYTGPTSTSTTTTINELAVELQETELELLTMIYSGANKSVTFSRNGGNFTAALVKPDPTFTHAEVQGEKAQVKVPNSLLAALGGEAVVVMTEYQGFKAAWDVNAKSQDGMDVSMGTAEDGNASMVGMPVGINVGVGGAFVKLTDLDEPFYIKLADQATEGYECAFWNETAGKWSAEGLEPWINETDGSYWCKATHLTVFANILSGVMRGFTKVLLCHQVHCIGAVGLKKFARAFLCRENCLWKSPAFLLYWFFVSAQVAVLFWARRADMQWTGAKLWSEKCFLTENPNFYHHPTSKYEKYLDKKDQMEEWIRQPLRHMSVFATTALVHRAVASKLCISVKELRVLMEWAQKTALQHHKEKDLSHKPRNKEYDRAKLVAFIPEIHKSMEAETKFIHEQINEGRLLANIWNIMKAEMPYVRLKHYSITVPAPDRFLLTLCKMCGSQLVSALFFESSAVDAMDDPLCAPPESMYEKVGAIIGVGFFSLFLATLPCIALSFLLRRKFIYKDKWEVEDMKNRLRMWKGLRILFRVLGVSYIVFSVFFNTSFLGNITTKDSIKWLLTSVFVFFKITIIVPMVVTLVLLVVAAVTGFMFRVRHCPKNHKLKYQELLKKGKCQLCAFDIEKGDEALRCEKCEWNMCAFCGTHAQDAEVRSFARKKLCLEVDVEDIKNRKKLLGMKKAETQGSEGAAITEVVEADMCHSAPSQAQLAGKAWVPPSDPTAGGGGDDRPVSLSVAPAVGDSRVVKAVVAPKEVKTPPEAHRDVGQKPMSPPPVSITEAATTAAASLESGQGPTVVDKPMQRGMTPGSATPIATPALAGDAVSLGLGTPPVLPGMTPGSGTPPVPPQPLGRGAAPGSKDLPHARGTKMSKVRGMTPGSSTPTPPAARSLTPGSATPPNTTVGKGMTPGSATPPGAAAAAGGGAPSGAAAPPLPGGIPPEPALTAPGVQSAAGGRPPKLPSSLLSPPGGGGWSQKMPTFKR